jgi:hypothetical protein
MKKRMDIPLIDSMTFNIRYMALDKEEKKEM